MARSKGQGSITLRKDGLYMGRIMRNGISKTFYNKDKKIVERQLLEFSKMSQSDFDKKNLSVKFQKYLHDYIYTYKYGHIKDTSFDRLDTIYRVHILGSSIGVLPLCELSDVNVQIFINGKCNSNLSYSTVKKIYELVRSVLYYAYKKNDISIDIGGIIKMPSSEHFKPTKVIEIYSVEDMDKIISFISNPNNKKDRRFLRYADSFLIMYYTGLRAGELLCLKWDDVDFINRVIHINKSVSIVCDRERSGSDGMHYNNVVTSPKTVKSIRDIPISDNCYAAFLRLLDSYDYFVCKCDYVVCSCKKDFIRLRSFEKKFKQICERVGVEYKGIHAIRHTFASRLIDNNVSPKVVSDLLGHSNVVFTLNRYVHIDNDSKKEAVNYLL